MSEVGLQNELLSDKLMLDYQLKVRTIQQAIKTQNEVLINKLNTIINQATLDAYQALEDNLKKFQLSYDCAKKLQKTPNITTSIHLNWIREQIATYQDTNLKSTKQLKFHIILDVYHQLSQSISNLQSGASQNDSANSSLLEVLQLFIRAGELYSKNLKELLNFQSPPEAQSSIQSFSSFLAGQEISYDDRIARIETQIEKYQFKQSYSFNIKCNAIFDFHPIRDTNFAIISTFDNDLLVYDIAKKQILKLLEPLRFAPCSIIFLYGVQDNQLKREDLLAFGGSEFDPNIYIYNFHLGKRIQTLPGHDRSVRYMIQLGDIQTLVSSGRDSRLFFWNLLKSEPIQILQIPTMEIIDLQLNAYKNSLYCLSIDGKITVYKLNFQEVSTNNGSLQQQQFFKSELVNLIDIQETSSLSQILWVNQKLMVVSFASGWLSGKNLIKVLEEKEHQTTVKFDKTKHYLLEEEIYQLNSIIMDNSKIMIFGICKKSGLVVGFQYPQMIPIQIEGQKKVDRDIRWNVKVMKCNNKVLIIKYGLDDQLDVFEIQQ